MKSLQFVFYLIMLTDRFIILYELM